MLLGRRPRLLSCVRDHRDSFTESGPRTTDHQQDQMSAPGTDRRSAPARCTHAMRDKRSKTPRSSAGDERNRHVPGDVWGRMAIDIRVSHDWSSDASLAGASDASVVPGANPAPFPLSNLVTQLCARRLDQASVGCTRSSSTATASRRTCSGTACHVHAERARLDTALADDRRCARGPTRRTTGSWMASLVADRDQVQRAGVFTRVYELDERLLDP